MTSHVLLSSECQDWRTPEWFLDMVRRVGPIALDPATSRDNPTRARQYFAHYGHCADGWIGNDGLAAKIWPRDGLTFINPPYGAHLSGPVDPDYKIIRKGLVIGRGRGWAERIAQHPGEWLALVPVRTETEWWRRMFYAATLTLFWSSEVHGSRISFIDPRTNQPGTQSNLASTVFYHGPDPSPFILEFADHGTLVRGGAFGQTHKRDYEISFG